MTLTQIQSLRLLCVSGFFKFILGVWKQRLLIRELCDAFAVLSPQESELRKSLAESQQSLERLETELRHEREKVELLTGSENTARGELKELHESYNNLLIRKEAPEERIARDHLELAKLEIEDLTKRLDREREDHEKSKRHIAKMWHFISERHRLNLHPGNGTIREILMRTDRP